jgi:hypothetical protein
MYPEITNNELNKISKLLSPQIMYHGPIWNNKPLNDPPPPSLPQK